MKSALSLVTLIAAVPAFAEDTRQMDAHEHGVGALNIAVDDTTIAMEFHAPGADIVGFEYMAEIDADLVKVSAALETLSAPLTLFALPEAAGCTVTDAKAELEGDDDHADHPDEEHKDDDHDEHKHDDHGDEEHEEHADEAGHTEFRAEYSLTCTNPDALSEITFSYFEAFPNAKEVEVQIITSTGAQAYEVMRDAPVLKLEP